MVRHAQARLSRTVDTARQVEILDFMWTRLQSPCPVSLTECWCCRLSIASRGAESVVVLAALASCTRYMGSQGDQAAGRYYAARANGKETDGASEWATSGLIPPGLLPDRILRLLGVGLTQGRLLLMSIAGLIGRPSRDTLRLCTG